METYPWKTIDPQDELHIESLNGLSLNDVHVLTKLYQPLIGANAFNLYMTLFADLGFQNQRKDLTMSTLLTKVDMGIPDFFYARIKLEGIGLLEIYRSKNEEGRYIYRLEAPLTPAEFFKDSLLRTLLLEKIGQRLFEEELGAFLKEPLSKEGYERTTRKFQDVYNFSAQNASQLSQMDFMPVETSKRRRVAKTIDQVDTFDYKFFLQGLAKNFVDPDSFTQEIRELMYTYHTIYGLDELTMQQLILESADIESGKVNAKKFWRNVEMQYANRQKARKLDNEQGQKQEAFADTQLEGKGFTPSEIQIIKHAKKYSPMDYLASIKDQKNSFVADSERYVIKDLIEQTPLGKDVVNILINYILNIKNNPIVHKNFAMQIAADWAENNVRTAEDAIVQIKKRYADAEEAVAKNQGGRRYGSYNRKPVQKEKLPDWAKKDSKPTDAADQVQTDEQGESIQERIERLRKMRELKEGN